MHELNENDLKSIIENAIGEPMTPATVYRLEEQCIRAVKTMLDDEKIIIFCGTIHLIDAPVKALAFLPAASDVIDENGTYGVNFGGGVHAVVSYHGKNTKIVDGEPSIGYITDIHSVKTEMEAEQ